MERASESGACDDEAAEEEEENDDDVCPVSVGYIGHAAIIPPTIRFDKHAPHREFAQCEYLLCHFLHSVSFQPREHPRLRANR